METENQPSTVEPVGDPGPDPGGQINDPAPDGGAPAPSPEPDQQQPGQPAPDQSGRPTRQQRRDTFNENRELKRALDEMTRQNRELAQRLDENARLSREQLDAIRPKPEDPLTTKQKELNERWNKVVQRLDKDPSAAEEFRELQWQMADLAAERRSREAMAQQRQQQPRQPSAYQQSLRVDFPWLDSDEEAQVAVRGEVARIARMERRNMRDPEVVYRTFRQAAAKVATDFGLPLPASYGNGANGANGRDRFAGTGSRGSNGGGNGAPDFSGFETDIAAAARVMYPQLTEEQAVAKWKASQAGRELARARAAMGR